MQISVTWTADSQMDMCVKLGNQDELLHCWKAQKKGEFSLAVERSENTDIQLVDAQTLQLLSQIQIPVMTRDLRDTRRRRRHAWSIF